MRRSAGPPGRLTLAVLALMAAAPAGPVAAPSPVTAAAAARPARAPGEGAATPRKRMVSLQVAYVTDSGSGLADTTEDSLGSSTSIFTNAIPDGPSYVSGHAAVYNGVTFRDVGVGELDADPAHALDGFDTVLLFSVCDIGAPGHGQAMAAVNAFLEGGHKVLIIDGDRCSKPNHNLPDYSGFAFPFRTDNPGPQGAAGPYTFVEPSTLTKGLSSGPVPGDAIGDANVMVTKDRGWYVAARGQNVDGITGPVLTYARTGGGGLAVYSGEDFGATGFGDSHDHLATLLGDMLLEPWDPDSLPSTAPAAPPPAVHLEGATMARFLPLDGAATTPFVALPVAVVDFNPPDLSGCANRAAVAQLQSDPGMAGAPVDVVPHDDHDCTVSVPTMTGVGPVGTTGWKTAPDPLKGLQRSLDMRTFRAQMVGALRVAHRVALPLTVTAGGAGYVLAVGPEKAGGGRVTSDHSGDPLPAAIPAGALPAGDTVVSGGRSATVAVTASVTFPAPGVYPFWLEMAVAAPTQSRTLQLAAGPGTVLGGPVLPQPRYVAVGDSITTGFSVPTCAGANEDRSRSPWGCGAQTAGPGTPYPDLVAAQTGQGPVSDDPRLFLDGEAPTSDVLRAGIWGYTAREALHAQQRGFNFDEYDDASLADPAGPALNLKNWGGAWVPELTAAGEASGLITVTLGANDVRFSDPGGYLETYFTGATSLPQIVNNLTSVGGDAQLVASLADFLAGLGQTLSRDVPVVGAPFAWAWGLVGKVVSPVASLQGKSAVAARVYCILGLATDCDAFLSPLEAANARQEADALTSLFAILKAKRSVGVRVVVTEYFQPVAAGDCADVDNVSEAIMDTLDSIIGIFGKWAGVDLVDLRPAFRGHEMGSSDPYVWGRACTLSGLAQMGGTGFTSAFDPHPDPEGDAAIAACVSDAVRGGTSCAASG